MSADQVRKAADAGIEIGSHGLRHVSLPGLAEAGLAAEAAQSRAILTETIDRDVTGFCYPYGHIDASSVAAVQQAGYAYGCAIWRSASTGPHALPRVYVGEATAHCGCGPRVPGTGWPGTTGARERAAWAGSPLPAGRTVQAVPHPAYSSWRNQVTHIDGTAPSRHLAQLSRRYESGKIRPNLCKALRGQPPCLKASFRLPSTAGSISCTTSLHFSRGELARRAETRTPPGLPRVGCDCGPRLRRAADRAGAARAVPADHRHGRQRGPAGGDRRTRSGPGRHRPAAPRSCPGGRLPGADQQGGRDRRGRRGHHLRAHAGGR